MRDTLTQDFRFAMRQFRHSPAFTCTAVLTLALGIGATTAIFSLLDGILLRPLPFPDVDRLVAVTTLEIDPGIAPPNLAQAEYLRSSYPNYFDWRRENHTFQSLASYDYTSRLFTKGNGEDARVIRGSRVSANLFSTLGVAPVLGRDFTAEEELPGHRVIILSHELWVTMFGASADVIGRTVTVSNQPYSVIGVMPAGFHFASDEPALFWATSAPDTEGPSPHTSDRDLDALGVVGRLRPEVSTDQALADLNAI